MSKALASILRHTHAADRPNGESVHWPFGLVGRPQLQGGPLPRHRPHDINYVVVRGHHRTLVVGDPSPPVRDGT